MLGQHPSVIRGVCSNQTNTAEIDCLTGRHVFIEYPPCPTPMHITDGLIIVSPEYSTRWCHWSDHSVNISGRWSIIILKLTVLLGAMSLSDLSCLPISRQLRLTSAINSFQRTNIHTVPCSNSATLKWCQNHYRNYWNRYRIWQVHWYNILQFQCT